MNKPLSLVLLASLGNLPYIDKSTGIVQVLQRPINKAGVTEYIKIPVSTLATSQECGAADTAAIDLVPDERYKGILYFEDKGTGLSTRRSSTQEYKSDMRLVCWLNTKKINGGIADMTIASKAMNDMITLLTSSKIVGSPFINIRVAVTRIPDINANLFSAYDYDEKRTQYLFYPFDYFAIDFNIVFSLARGCRPEIDVTTPPKC